MPDLPDGIVRVEWVEANESTQWVQTGVQFTKTMGYDIVFDTARHGATWQTTICGAYGYSSACSYAGLQWSDSGSSLSVFTYYPGTGTRHMLSVGTRPEDSPTTVSLHVSPQDGTVVNGVKVGGTGDTYGPIRNAYFAIFAQGRESYTSHSGNQMTGVEGRYIRVRSFRLFDTANGEEVLRDMIPVRKGREGMFYDVKNGVLYKSSENPLITGPDVSKPVMGLYGMRKIYTADDYIKDGLIAMWDGIENAGWGQHDAESTVWVNLVANSPFGNGERTGTGLTTNLPIWTDKSCYSPEFASGYDVKACFNVSATLDDTLSVVCGETVARTKNTALGRWNLTAMLGCDVRFCMDDTHLVKPTDTKSYSETQFQCWDHNAGNLGLDPEITRSYHVRKVGTSKLGIMANGGTEYQGGISNGRTENMRTYWPIIYTNNVTVEVFCIRCYSRELTADEIAHNYAIDKARFNLP